jgi:hypothetical protein
LTQPAVSRRIRELELALGVKVFERSGRTLRISPEGAALLGYANELLNTADEMAMRASTGDPLRGTLRLGDDAGREIRTAPRRERPDDAHGLRWICGGLRPGGGGDDDSAYDESDADDSMRHCVSPDERGLMASSVRR